MAHGPPFVLPSVPAPSMRKPLRWLAHTPPVTYGLSEEELHGAGGGSWVTSCRRCHSCGRLADSVTRIVFDSPSVTSRSLTGRSPRIPVGSAGGGVSEAARAAPTPPTLV